MVDVETYKQCVDLAKEAKAAGFKLSMDQGHLLSKGGFKLEPNSGIAKIMLSADEMQTVLCTDTAAVRNFLTTWEIFQRNLTHSTGLDAGQLAQLCEQQRVLRTLRDDPKPCKSRGKKLYLSAEL